MDIRIEGRSVLITGGSKGLGLAMAKAFAAAGGKVAIVARGAESLAAAEAEIKTLAPSAKVAAIGADIATAEGCNAAFAAAEKAFGQVDILINNAGTSQRAPFLEVSDALWQNDLDLKLFAAIRLGRLVWPGMAARKWGRIINVLNTGAKAPPAEGAPTAVSRAAGMALTKVQSHEGAKHNILVNAMLVGLIDSDQHYRRWQKSGSNESYEEWLGKLGASLPLGRYGKPEEFASLALFLCSEAGGYISGTAINVDGARSPVV
ncbi:SDR family NAD(P)-dependent oxidoreductase [Siccirubricoccus sp. KC 17139]|uniref:SDR family NAD(P)-dependent oxidoreductase n=1 Tax=Siccirubricoccus soli TaxID=2899147 RepID=A0ABT1CZM1_9PROT|nr:SDR family NAD(P)-dependent oxidoreductase [Siccirubricoccus soli]MCO6415115.1 SDR family NAD(P)-dependent oxidoreductase [Siccirubricoccus soli]MCP2681246.1 SDR family NAD(P)-dependent oxidoreductase [Siccirubricoccus soli]